MHDKEKKDEKANHPHNAKGDPKQEPHTAEVVSVPKEEFDALTAKAAECEALRDKYLRAQAEFENARKRLEKDKSDFVRYANDGLIAEFLPMFDNLELAERHINEAKDFKAVREGVDMIQSQIQKVLKDIGVERVKTTGEKFDPHFHEAIEMEETDDKGKDDGIIVAELKPGYIFNGRLLRPASVKIVKKR